MNKHETGIAVVLIAGLIAAIPAQAQVIHQVYVGGSDYCTFVGQHPGCDANFSLTAIELADGTVAGQYSDRFAGGSGGIQVVIDCLSVEGNDAWVSGWVKQGALGDFDLTGFPVATRVRDLGESQDDPPDQISFSWLGDATSCLLHSSYLLFDVPQGQVVVE